MGSRLRVGTKSKGVYNHYEVSNDPCTQKKLEGTSEMCERYAVPFAMEFDSSSFPVSLQPLTMALAFHFSIY